MTDPIFIRRRHGCLRWSVGKTTLSKHLRAGDVPSYRVGRITLIDAAAGDAFFKSRPRVPGKGLSRRGGQ